MKKNIVIYASLFLILGIASPVFAETYSTTNTGNTGVTPTLQAGTPGVTVTPTTDKTCVANLIDRRDNAIIDALDAYHASVRALLQSRMVATKAAWQLETTAGIRKAIKEASNVYRAAVVRARNTFREARRAAWDAARKAAHDCHVKNSDIGESSGDDKL